MTPTHHLPDELLAGYAAGVCGEPEALFIASHLTLCDACRASLVLHESIGGAILDDAPPLEVKLDPATIVARAPKQSEPPSEHEAMVVRELAEAQLPTILAPYLPEGLRWRFLAPGVKHVALALRWNGIPARLVSFPAGYVVSRHTHGGPEYTLCLRGAFTDGERTLHRGDVEICDDTHRHELQVASDGPCICLIVSDSPPVPLTWLGRLLRPFLG